MPDNINSGLFYESIGNNLRRYREARNYSLQDLADRVGVTKKTIQRYETAEIKIDLDRLKQIADALNIVMFQLLEGTYSSLGIQMPKMETVKIPVTTEFSYANDTFIYKKIIRYEETPKTWTNDIPCFYTLAPDESMDVLKINKNDLLLISQDHKFYNGDTVAAYINDTFIIRKAYYVVDKILLIPYSKNLSKPSDEMYEINITGQNSYIIGKVIKVIIDMP